MVITIMDRLVRGYIYAGRQELESKSYKLLSSQERLKACIISPMVKMQDSWYNIYHRQVFHHKLSVDDLMASLYGITNLTFTNRAAQSRMVRTSVIVNNLTIEFDKEWSAIWDVGSSPYAVSLDKVTLVLLSHFVSLPHLL